MSKNIMLGLSEMCTQLKKDGQEVFVNMVQRGIQSAHMQLVTEIYLFLHNVCQMTNADVSAIFARWNQDDTASHLLGITATLLQEKDLRTHEDLVTYLKDVTHCDDTLRWMAAQSLVLDVDCSTITSALQARTVSTLEDVRMTLCEAVEDVPRSSLLSRSMKIKHIRQAYYLAKIVIYAQGFAMLTAGAETYHWNLPLDQVQSLCFEDCGILVSFCDQPQEKHLLLHPPILHLVQEFLPELREMMLRGTAAATPMPATGAALTYLDQLGASYLGANLIEGQQAYLSSL